MNIQKCALIYNSEIKASPSVKDDLAKILDAKKINYDVLDIDNLKKEIDMYRNGNQSMSVGNGRTNEREQTIIASRFRYRQFQFRQSF